MQHFRFRTLLAVAGFSLLAACSGDLELSDPSAGPIAAAPLETTAPLETATSTVPTTTPVTTSTESPATTVETTTTFATATTVAAVGTIEGAERFEDPQGAYALQVDPDWETAHNSFSAGVEQWLFDEEVTGFRPNLNVLTQSVPGISLDEFIELSIRNGPDQIGGFTITNQEVFVSDAGDETAVMEYTAQPAVDPLKFLAFVVIRDGEAIISTLTSTVGAYDDVRAMAEPYMRSLETLP